MTGALEISLVSLALLAAPLAAEARYGTGLIGLKNLRASQLLEGRISGNSGAATRLENLRRGLNFSKGWPRIVERGCFKFLKCHR
jgi:hypothetical protein